MELKVYKGGDAKDADMVCSFIRAEVTDTRLMGVLGLHMQWMCQYDEQTPPVSRHFYLYCDYEELGLEYIHSFVFDDSEDEKNDYYFRSFFGGLGAHINTLTMRQTLYLCEEFARVTEERKQPLPEEYSHLSQMLKTAHRLSERELQSLRKKICCPPETDFGVINSYLMRVFGKDDEGALLLQSPDAPDLVPSAVGLKHFGTFLSNNIEKRTDETGNSFYLCESLVETENAHHIITSDVTLDGMYVKAVRRLGDIRISTYEASLILNQPEYVNVYEMTAFPDRFFEEFADYSVGFTQAQHDTGIMFIEYNSDNKHVEKAKYRLSGDVAGIYYMTVYGQLITASNSIAGILAIENNLVKSGLADDLDLTKRYNFGLEIVYEFAESGCIDFEEFLEELENE